MLATGSTDRTARLWDVASGQCVKTFTGQADAVTTVAFSGDGKHLTSGGGNAVTVWVAQ